MKKTHILKAVSVVMLLCLLLQPMVPAGAEIFLYAFAADNSEPEALAIITEKNDDGSYERTYLKDKDGNIIEREYAPMVEASASLPSSYDTRSLGYVTSVKNQAAAGSCWAFAAISNMESSMIKQGYKTASTADYSEAHLVWFAQRRSKNLSDPLYGDGPFISNPYDEGFNWYGASATLFRGSGLQLESNAPWYEDNSVTTMYNKMNQVESTRYTSYGRLYSSERAPGDSISDAKALLMKNGNLQLGYLDIDEGYNATNNCYYQNLYTSSNHAVAVVGWDDNFSRSKFNSSMRPSKNGAWLIKGSWDTNFGDNGYYWISYYDPSITDLASFVAAPENIYDNIYQYDGSIMGRVFMSSYSIASANRFKATRNERLTHVGYFHYSDGYDNLKVEVYRSNSGYTSPSSSDPTKNMTLISNATTTVSNVSEGYYTIELKNPVDLKPNDYFTIKITVTNVSGTYAYAAFEGPDDYEYGYTYDSDMYQSHLYYNSTWYDAYYYQGTNYHNAPIKAFTSEINTSFTLSYDANGGSGAPSPQTGSTEYTMSSTIPTRFGYTFIGWETSSTATSAHFFPGDSVRLSGNVTLYAVWKAASAISTSTTYNASIDFANQEVYYSFTPSSSGKYTFESTGSLDSRIYLYSSSEAQLGYNDDDGDGNNFKLSANLTSGTKYYIKVRAYSTNTGSTSFKVTKQDVTTYTITYNANGGTNPPSSQVKEKDVTLTLTTAKPTKTYTVTYDANGGSVSPASKSVNCTFKNWNTSQNGGGTSYAPGATYTANSAATLYAQWTNPTYGTLQTPTRSGYIFNGWYTASSGGTKITSSTTLTGNTTIYAQWTKAVTYTISYNANGGTNAPSSQTKTKDVPLTLTSAKPSKNYTVTYNANGGSVSPSTKSVGCTFKNWNTSQNGSGTSYAPGASYTANSAATLYAQWTNPTYGTLATPTRSGYVFNGWFTASAGGTKITSSTTLTGNKTIYAQWTESPYDGKCGDTMTWHFDLDTGVLTISGTGKMYDYTYSKDSSNVYHCTSPWYPYIKSITAIVINEGVTHIGKNAFFTSAASSVSLPESLTTIERGAFINCKKIKEISIPENVSFIGEYAFFGCHSLQKFDVDLFNDYFDTDSYGVLYDYSKKTLIQYPLGRTSDSYSVYSGTETIGYDAFAYADTLTDIYIPISVKTVRKDAFARSTYRIYNVSYGGSPSDWNNITIEGGNEEFTFPLNMTFTTKVIYKEETFISNKTFADVSDLTYNWEVTEGTASGTFNDYNCNVRFMRKGNLKIKLSVSNGIDTVECSYNFTVKYAWWQWIIKILLLGFIWY